MKTLFQPNRAKQIANRMKPVKDKLKILHQKTYESEIAELHKKGDQTKFPSWDDKTEVKFLDWRQKVVDETIDEKEKWIGGSGDKNVFTKNGRPLAFFINSVFGTRKDIGRISWEDFKNYHWRPYMDKALQTIVRIEKEKAYYDDIVSAFDHLEKKNGGSITYGALLERLKEKSKCISSSDAFWQFPYFQPEFHQQVVTRHTFFDKLKIREDIDSIQDRVIDDDSEAMNIDLPLTRTSTCPSTAAGQENIPPTIAVFSCSSTGEAPLGRSLSRTKTTITGRRSSCVNIPAPDEVPREDVEDKHRSRIDETSSSSSSSSASSSSSSSSSSTSSSSSSSSSTNNSTISATPSSSSSSSSNSSNSSTSSTLASPSSSSSSSLSTSSSNISLFASQLVSGFLTELLDNANAWLSDVTWSIIGKVKEKFTASSSASASSSSSLSSSPVTAAAVQVLTDAINDVQLGYQNQLDLLAVQIDQKSKDLEESQARYSKVKDKDKDKDKNKELHIRIKDLEAALSALKRSQEHLENDQEKLNAILDTKYRQFILKQRHKDSTTSTQERRPASEFFHDLADEKSVDTRELCRRVGDVESDLFKKHYHPHPKHELRTIPHFVDLSSELIPVQDQGTTYPGHFFALLALKQWQELKNNKLLQPLSLAYLIEKTTDGEDGACIEDALVALRKHGIITETSYTKSKAAFSMNSTTTKTSLRLESLRYRIDGYLRIQDINALRVALTRYGPITLTLPVYDISKVHFWIPQNPSSRPIAYHTVLIVGYNDQTQDVIIRNSFGTSWGINGHTRMSYSQIFGKYHVAITLIDGVPDQGTDATSGAIAVKDILSGAADIGHETEEQRAMRKMAQKLSEYRNLLGEREKKRS